MPLHHKWVSHLETEAEKSKFRDALYNDGIILGRLAAIIDEFIEELDSHDYSIKEYENPAFPYLKADRIGERRGLQRVGQLLKFLKE